MPFDLIDFNDVASDDYGLDTCEAVFPVSTRPVSMMGKDKHMDMPAYKATVGYQNGEVTPLGIVGRDYKVMPNHDFFGTIENAVRQSIRPDLRADVSVRTQLAGGGAWTRREYVFPAFADKLKSTESETQIGLRIVAWNSYDGSASAGCMVGLIDWYCTNGMVFGKNIDDIKRRHTSGLTPELFVPMLTNQIGNIQFEVRKIEEMMHRKMEIEDAKELLQHAFSARRAEKLAERVATEATVRGWNVFALHSALTYYSSHNSDEFKVRETGNDNVARTLMTRENEVRKLLSSRSWDAWNEQLAA